MVARPEEDRPRRVGLHADRAEEAVLERLLLALDLDERAGRRVRRGLERLEAAAGRVGRALQGAVTCAADAPAPWNAASCLSSSATRVARAWRSAWSASR